MENRNILRFFYLFVISSGLLLRSTLFCSVNVHTDLGCAESYANSIFVHFLHCYCENYLRARNIALSLIKYIGHCNCATIKVLMSVDWKCRVPFQLRCFFFYCFFLLSFKHNKCLDLYFVFFVVICLFTQSPLCALGVSTWNSNNLPLNCWIWFVNVFRKKKTFKEKSQSIHKHYPQIHEKKRI